MRRIIFCLIVFTNLSELFAQENDTLKPLHSLTLEELMEVTITTPARKPQRVTDAPSVVSVFTRQDIEKMGVVSLVDILKYAPGITVSVSPAGDYRVAIRGLRKPGETLFLINGQRMLNFYNGRAIFDLPVDMIERIEIIRGPGSALYGANAVAGVINVITGPQERTVNLKGGTNTTLNGNMNYFIKEENYSLGIAAGFFHTNGANVLIDQDISHLEPWSLTYGENQAQTNRWVQDAYATAQFEMGNFKAGLFELFRNRGPWTGPLFTMAPDSRSEYNQFAFNTSYQLNINEELTITPRAYVNTITINDRIQEAPDGYISPVSGDVFNDGKVTREKYLAPQMGTELQANIKINDDFEIIGGNVFEREWIPSYQLDRNYRITGDQYFGEFANHDNVPLFQQGQIRNIFAFYLQGDYQYKKMLLNAGMRLDSYSDFGQAFNPRVSAIYQLFPFLNLKARYSEAFRAPTFQELYDNTTLGNEFGVNGNPNLKPEIIQSMELGGEFAKWRVIIRGDVFYNIYQNLIAIYDPHGSGSIGRYENIGNFNILGYEAELISEIIEKRLNIFVNFSQFMKVFEWNEATARPSDLEFFADKSICERMMRNFPAVIGNAGISASILKLELFAGFNYGGKSRNNQRFYLEEDRFVRIPAYLQGNFSVVYPFKNFRFRIAANNLGRKFADPDQSTNINAFGRKGLLQPGPTFLGGITYNFQ